MNTASMETRPALVQYTSRRCRMSANSSSTRAVPTPKAAAVLARQPSECSGAASPATPATTITMTPNTMWCRCMSPRVTLPGHQRT